MHTNSSADVTMLSYSLSLILLAGGQGSRIGGSLPKQFLRYHGKPLALYSLEVLLSLPHMQCVVVCDSRYQDLFTPFEVTFALPGKERMLSVASGMQALTNPTDFVLVHDAARPFVKRDDILRLVETAHVHGAATLATPVSSTIKQADETLFVQKTLPRELLWEIQTPQMLKGSLLKEGLDLLLSQNRLVTDEMSIAEEMHHPVKLVPGDPMNFKVTTPKDLLLADLLFTSTRVSL